MKLSSIALLCVSVGSSFSAVANDSWEFNGTVASISVDSEAAANEGVDDSALQVGLYADYFQSDWVTTVGASFLIYDDNREFQQTVVGDGAFNDGDISTESSDATAVLAHLATGYRWTFGENGNMDLIAQGGLSFPVMSERLIGSCSDCYSEDIELDGGAFVKARAGYNGDSVRFGVVLQQFVSGDLGTAIGLEIGSSF